MSVSHFKHLLAGSDFLKLILFSLVCFWFISVVSFVYIPIYLCIFCCDLRYEINKSAFVSEESDTGDCGAVVWQKQEFVYYLPFSAVNGTKFPKNSLKCQTNLKQAKSGFLKQPLVQVLTRLDHVAGTTTRISHRSRTRTQNSTQ